MYLYGEELREVSGSFLTARPALGRTGGHQSPTPQADSQSPRLPAATSNLSLVASKNHSTVNTQKQLSCQLQREGLLQKTDARLHLVTWHGHQGGRSATHTPACQPPSQGSRCKRDALRPAEQEERKPKSAGYQKQWMATQTGSPVQTQGQASQHFLCLVPPSCLCNPTACIHLLCAYASL